MMTKERIKFLVTCILFVFFQLFVPVLLRWLPEPPSMTGTILALIFGAIDVLMILSWVIVLRRIISASRHLCDLENKDIEQVKAFAEKIKVSTYGISERVWEDFFGKELAHFLGSVLHTMGPYAGGFAETVAEGILDNCPFAEKKFVLEIGYKHEENSDILRKAFAQVRERRTNQRAESRFRQNRRSAYRALGIVEKK